jgi:hypothetical protein
VMSHLRTVVNAKTSPDVRHIKKYALDKQLFVRVAYKDLDEEQVQYTLLVTFVPLKALHFYAQQSVHPRMYQYEHSFTSLIMFFAYVATCAGGAQ